MINSLEKKLYRKIFASVLPSRLHRQICSVNGAGGNVMDALLFQAIKDAEADIEVKKLEHLLVF